MVVTCIIECINCKEFRLLFDGSDLQEGTDALDAFFKHEKEHHPVDGAHAQLVIGEDVE